MDGRVWGVNEFNQIFTRPGVDGGWLQVDGSLRYITAGLDGRIWGINAAD